MRRLLLALVLSVPMLADQTPLDPSIQVLTQSSSDHGCKGDDCKHSPVPEPGTGVMMLGAAVAGAVWTWRKRSAS